MFKAVLCTLTSKYIHSSLATWCLYTACKQESLPCDLRVVEGTVNEDIDRIYERLIDEHADFIAFSCYIWNIKKTLTLCERLKKAGVTIALGGPEVSYRQRDILENNPFVDFVLNGEGERTMPELIKCLIHKKKPIINGVSYFFDGDYIISEADAVDFESTVSPYCEEYFDSLGTKIAYIESSRGCPFSCAFCLSGRCGKVRFLPLDRVKNEMVLLSQKGARIIKFVDRTFNCNPKRATQILDFIREEYGKRIVEGTCFHFEIAADILNEDVFNSIKNLPKGAAQFEVGIQSFNSDTLKAINRKTNVDLVEANVRRLISYGNCHVHIDLIAGLPLEGYESFVKGFNRAYTIGANMLQLGFLKILYGSPMGEERESYPCEYSCEPPYEVISTPYISSEELQRLHICESELERLYNSGRFCRTLKYVTGFILPYNLFYGFGEHLLNIGEKGSIPLDKYTCLAFDYFSNIKGVDKTVLRDLMLLDRISTNNSDVLPSCLKVKDGRLSKLKGELSGLGVKHKSVAILYSVNTAVYCDYSEERNPVTSQWTVHKTEI